MYLLQSSSFVQEQIQPRFPFGIQSSMAWNMVSTREPSSFNDPANRVRTPAAGEGIEKLFRITRALQGGAVDIEQDGFTTRGQGAIILFTAHGLCPAQGSHGHDRGRSHSWMIFTQDPHLPPQIKLCVGGD